MDVVSEQCMHESFNNSLINHNKDGEIMKSMLFILSIDNGTLVECLSIIIVLINKTKSNNNSLAM